MTSLLTVAPDILKDLFEDIHRSFDVIVTSKTRLITDEVVHPNGFGHERSETDDATTNLNSFHKTVDEYGVTHDADS